MNPTIKARIEKIKNGEVPEGYKRTKIGIVPNEWKERKLKNYFTRLTRKNAENNQNVLTISAQYGLISQEDFFNKSVASENKSNYFLLLKGDFAYNKSYSNGYPYGAIKRLEYYDKGIVSPLYICMEPQNSFVADYFVQYFEGGLLNGEIHAFAQEGARNHGLLNIAVDDFFNTNVVVPCEAEQQRIAEILATQDKVIELKEKLLKEKQRQKKYLMHCFYTHSVKSFVRLSDIAVVIMGQSPDSQYYNEDKLGLPLLQGNADILNGYPAPRLFTKCFTKTCDIGDILLSVRAPVGSISRSNIVACIGRGLCAIRAGKFQEYLFHFLTYYENKWKTIAQGSTFESISGNDIKNLLIPIAYNTEYICKILSTADKEIELLKKDIEQEKLKKKSLMQLLLTGIVRVN